MNDIEKILVGDLPEDLMVQILNTVARYSVGLIAINLKDYGEEGIFIGSGTFIKIDKRFFILTAAHVISSKIFNGSQAIGLSFSPDVHNFRIDKQYLSICYEWNKQYQSKGPDLGLIELPLNHIGTIQAKKNFWNLQNQKDIVLGLPYANNGVWAICGCAHEFTDFKTNERGYSKVMTFHHYLWFSGIESESVVDDYDYFETSVNYESRDDLPKSFGGLSGGGLWQIPLFKQKDGKITFDDPILSGLAFYQTEVKNNMRFIRCHGRNSIYLKLPGAPQLAVGNPPYPGGQESQRPPRRCT